ncbi:MAG: DEAD/DEAH box helicase, partial [Caldilineae bacterium]
FYAQWRPHLATSNIQERLDALVDAMPPICRAYNLATLDQAPNPGALLDHFITTMTDQAVRHWAPSQPPRSDASPAHHWLERLLAEQAQIALPPQPAHRLHQDWRTWLENLHIISPDADFQVAFELVEPEPHAPDRWLLRYHLQAKVDNDILVSASRVWQEKSHTLRVGDLRFEQPQERLLAGLGMASRLFPPIKESLRAPRPEMAVLTTREAHQFLQEIGPLFASSGFGVLLPDWWRGRRRTRLGLRLHFIGEEEQGGGALSSPENGRFPEPALQRPVRFRWQLALGDDPLSREEFDQLIAMDAPLVNLRGRWVELDPQQVQAARRFLEDGHFEGSMSLLQAVRTIQAYSEEGRQRQEGNLDFLHQVVGRDLPDALPLDSVQVSGWLEEALARLRGVDGPGEIQEPPGFVGTLRPYQRRGVGWLWYLRTLGMGACLADDMGLGKTVEAIALLLHARSQAQAAGRRLAPTLLICPTSVLANWRHEIERFAPALRPMVHHGSGRSTSHDFVAALAEHDLIITSYGTARRDVELLAAQEWDALILDEAQNIKNPSAKQTQAVRRIPAHHRIALTGTPVENRLLELWSIMEFLNPGYLGSRDRFRQRFVTPIERYNDEEAAAELRRLVQPFLLRRLKTDPTIISDLPEKNEMVVYCPLTKEQAELYNQVVQETMTQVEQSQGIQRRGLVLTLLLKLKQVCNHPAHYLGEAGPLSGRSGKLSRLTEMLDEALSVDDRALIFTQFVEMGHLLKAHLEETLGREVLFLHGGTPARQRAQMVEAFQAEKNGPPIFILSLRAGGVGLNLTRANHVFHFDRWWNPAVENQATDRAFRIGQKRSVYVYKFVVAGTLEERIHEMIESKQSLAESIVGSGEEWLTEMDTDELRRLLALRRDEVEEDVLNGW